MQKKFFKAVMAAVAVVGMFAILLGSELWVKANIYHPDAVTTVRNSTTGKNTQAYLIGKTQVYIDKTYRMDMPLWQIFVNGEGTNNDKEHYRPIQPGDADLALNSHDDEINPNPFVMRLKIKNLAYIPIDINAQNFKIRNAHGEIVAPSQAWQDKLAEAGFFAGTGKMTQIDPNDEKILWLVYGTKTEVVEPGSVQQEFVRMNYDSDSDILATKVEFPFNYTEDTLIGNYTSDYQYRYNIGFAGALLWLALCGTVYYRKKDNYSDDEE